jgi:leader peptidase (prepilin peptidase)/N-methyltransferase
MLENINTVFENLPVVFQSSPWLFYSFIGLTGLCVGSFLNVVAWRLPIMMEREWKRECHEYLELEQADPEQETASLNLARPASACPHCGHKIRFWENIPVLSYLILRGKCSSCGTRISLQYPLVELFTGIVSLVVAERFGVSLQTVTALGFSWVLIALTLIDLKKQLLPDNMTIPLLWSGIFISFFNVHTDLKSSVIGAMAGYLILWSVYQLFKLLTKKEGMGFGDFKLLAALGAWTGAAYLPQIILVSSITGSIIGILMLVTGFTRRQQHIPFGPYLAIAGWIALLWGETINSGFPGFFPGQ